MKILITGGCGYIGTILVKKLLLEGYEVVVVDSQWFGNYLGNNKKLKIIKSDIRKIDNYKKHLKGTHTVIHLANIANDISVELKPNLSWETNVLATMQLIEKSIEYKVKKFLYASSGSVYGLKKERKVTEGLELTPISLYNKTKMISERVLMSYQNEIDIYCIRPATVCGVSPRMRLDLTVNILTYNAIKNNIINVFGGKQIRPNIHINDMVDIYCFLLKKKIPTGIYNAGFENMSIISIAKLVSNITGAKIEVQKSNDPRSYRLDSSKLLKQGFKPKCSIENGIEDVIEFTKSTKILKSFFSVKWLKDLSIK